MTTDPPALRRADWVPPDRDLSRPDSAAERLAALAAAVGPGERLGTKGELRTLCGVSVGTFNEALRMVQARGLVTVRRGPGGGLFAGRQSPMVRLGNAMLALDEDAASVAEAIRLRNTLDPLLVEDALQHAADADIAAMRAHLERMEAAADGRDVIAFVHANWALHARIARTSPSQILRSFYLGLLELIEAHTLSVSAAAGVSLPQDLHLRHQLHADLVDAIADRDPRALDLIRVHNTSPPAGPDT
jgi:DNA-binding FadR family transcriptional regulator